MHCRETGGPDQHPHLCPLCRVLEALWELLLRAILQALGAHRDVSPDFYGRFHFTLEVRGHALGFLAFQQLLGCPGLKHLYCDPYTRPWSASSMLKAKVFLWRA